MNAALAIADVKLLGVMVTYGVRCAKRALIAILIVTAILILRYALLSNNLMKHVNPTMNAPWALDANSTQIKPITENVKLTFLCQMQHRFTPLTLKISFSALMGSLHLMLFPMENIT